MPAVSFSKFACSEKTNTRRETWNPTEGLTCSLELYVAWSDRYNFINDLALYPLDRAWPYTSTTEAPGIFSGIRPVPVEINVVPVRDSGYVQGCQGADYKVGVATVTYKMWSPVRETVEFQTKAIRLDPRQFKWATPDGSNQDQRNVHGIEGLSQVVNRLILVREFDTPLLLLPSNFYTSTGGGEARGINARSGLIGTVHSKKYTSTLIVERSSAQGSPQGTKFVEFAKGTLLLLDPIVTPGPDLVKFPPNGNVIWRRGFRWKFRWLYRPEGHNYFWKPSAPIDTSSSGTTSTGGWDRLTIGDATYLPFDNEDHGTLLIDDPKQTKLLLNPEPYKPSRCNSLDVSGIPGV